MPPLPEQWIPLPPGCPHWPAALPIPSEPPASSAPLYHPGPASDSRPRGHPCPEPHATLELVFPEDRASIQINLFCVLEALSQNRIDTLAKKRIYGRILTFEVQVDHR